MTCDVSVSVRARLGRKSVWNSKEKKRGESTTADICNHTHTHTSLSRRFTDVAVFELCRLLILSFFLSKALWAKCPHAWACTIGIIWHFSWLTTFVRAALYDRYGVGAACRPVVMETYRHAVGLCERVLALTATTLSDLLLVVSVEVENEGAPLDPGWGCG